MKSQAKHAQAPSLAPFLPLTAPPCQILLVTPAAPGEMRASDDPGLAFTTVPSAQACHSALADYRPKTYDAIVIDWQIGEEHGPVLLAALRQSAYPAPLVALLPFHRPALVHAARQAGATGWLVKTADYRLQLPHVITAAIQHAQLQRERDEGDAALHRAQRETLVAQARGDLLQQQLHSLLERLSEGVLILDADEGRVVTANAAAERLFGFPFQPRQPLADHREFRAELSDGRALAAETSAPLLALRQGETVVQEEVVLIQPDARRIPAKLDAAPQHASGDGVVSVVGIIHDRSESNHLAALREAVIAIASHQLKNPLTVILGYSALLLKSRVLSEDARAHRAIDKIRHESLRLRQLVDELLEFSRLELDRIALQAVALDLTELVGAVVTRQREALRPRTIALDPAPPAPYVGDYGRLAQAVGTLIGLRAADPAASLGVALGDHTAEQLAACGAANALPLGEHYLTIAIGDDATAAMTAPCHAPWRPFPTLMAAEELVNEQSLGLPISAALVRAHGGMLYATEAHDYLLVLPVH